VVYLRVASYKTCTDVRGSTAAWVPDSHIIVKNVALKFGKAFQDTSSFRKKSTCLKSKIPSIAGSDLVGGKAMAMTRLTEVDTMQKFH
jgi:hypothetical protein